MTMRFGFECEVTAGAGDLIALLHDNGHAVSPGLHSYHCECDSCDYNGSHLFFGQNDCTVDGEIITTILDSGGDKAERAFTALAGALRTVRATVDDSAGFHVHVDRRDLDPAAELRLLRLFVRYERELHDLAAGPLQRVRGYNAPLSHTTDPFASTSPPRYFNGWLAKKQYTVEFRLWNATRVEWRMRMAVGVSVAMVTAAMAGVEVTADQAEPLEVLLGEYLDADAFAGILRQRHLREKGK